MPGMICVCLMSLPGLADEYVNKEMLVEPVVLLPWKHSIPVTILDVRSSEAYAAGHVPGALHVNGSDWAKNFQDGKDEKAWVKRLSALGLTPQSKVVVYDDATTKDAARIWWILKYWGVEDVRLLNGMWTGWKASGQPVTKPNSKTPEVKPSEFSLGTRRERLATKQDVLDSLTSKSAGIVDARTEAEYTGKNKLNNKYGGCMPGAKNLDWAQLVDAKTQRFKSASELSELFAAHKIDLNQAQIAHCQGGGRSSVMNFALELMGAKNVRNYHASWGEWGNSDEVPIEGKK